MNPAKARPLGATRARSQARPDRGEQRAPASAGDGEGSRGNHGARLLRRFLALPFPLFRLSRVNIANQLTLLRIALLPLYAWLFLGDSVTSQWLGLGVFGLCSFTDWLDGHVARRFHMVTNFGKVMDPLADKLLMLTAMILFVQLGLVPGWMIVVIWWRELAVMGLRTLLAARRHVLAADAWGKAKTALQVVAVVGGMVVYCLQNTLNASLPDWRMRLAALGAPGEWAARLLDTNAVAYWTMLAAAALALASGAHYFKSNWRVVCLELEDAERLDA